ncbi:glycosyltransferase [Pseudarthrobacter sulfonivorans]|uniref:glycosyltransferase n=1 Tax=Pseudarthrobacter sulfonivorans TaxID=121292 RepID=UPI00277E66CA|nr:glycosyltransferase [Pseudarthrobacter sulfonivorans]MDQ0000837.1 GT2 family glycosyltransferase [Pseudarthrobacter sulfonivorans]
MTISHIAAIVVHHRSYATLGATISRLLEEGLNPEKVLIVDNSEDAAHAAQVEQALPIGVRIIFTPNAGYGAAVNTGVAWHAGNTPHTDYLLVSTHEALPELGSLKSLAGLLDRHPRTAVVGPALVTGELSQQIWSLGGYFSKVLGLPRHHGHRAPSEDLASAQARRVQWLDGAFLLFRRAVLEAQPVDEDYFLYMEETDHQLGLQRQGWEVHIEPAAVVWQSSGGTPSFYQARNVQLFQARNGYKFQSNLAAPYIMISTLARDILRGRGLKNLKPLVAGWRAGRSLVRGRNKRRITAIINPLGGALAHYTEALASTLKAAGAEVQVLSVLEPSLSGRSRWRWLLDYLKLLMSVRRSSSALRTKTLVVWPVLGFFDLVLVRLLCGGSASVVYHDPKPLVRAIGSDAVSARLIASLPGLPDVVVHSQAAGETMQRLGFKSRMHFLAHPMFPPTTSDVASSEFGRQKPVVRVLGQFKRDRDVGVLMALAALVGNEIDLEIVGRGWPEVSGWDVDSRFVQEQELDELVRTSAAVVIPYRRFYQSGIAIRALESNTPIVGRAATSLSDLYGHTSDLLVHPDPTTGVVDGQSWANAVRYAVTKGRGDAAKAAADYYAGAISDWRAWSGQSSATREYQN